MRLEGSKASGVTLRNNVLWVQAGYDLSVASDAQRGFASDYNLLVTSGSGQGRLSGRGCSRPTLAAWQNTAFTDDNSLAQDPLFVDRYGADNQLGYVDPHTTVATMTSMCRAPAAVTTAVPWPRSDSGTGLPVPLSGTWTCRTSAVAGIDRGDAADSSATNRSERRLRQPGAYGNTSRLRRARRVPDGHAPGRRRGLAGGADVRHPLAEPRRDRPSRSS